MLKYARFFQNIVMSESTNSSVTKINPFEVALEQLDEVAS